ncbi:hypothetical protein LAB1_01300 [Roseibium sp. LAB1]
MMSGNIRSLTLAAAICFSGLPAIAAEVTLTFDKVTTVASDGDMSVCTKRYGDGYKSSPTDKGDKHRVTDNGHAFEVLSNEVSQNMGVVSFHNTYLMTFAGETAPVSAELWATGLAGEALFRGTFSDGTCRGHVEMSAS